ncbi:MAG: DUF2470 domain-containing protein [Pseudomonadota bacterium]
MSETPDKKVLRETDDEAIRQAKTLIHEARHAALAANNPDGHPSVSRVQISTDTDGAIVLLTSALSPHTQAMIDQPTVSLLIGEPGKGDPLAHPRVTVFAKAAKIERDTEDHARLRHRHLSRHPKAELYADFGDFSFFKLSIEGASLNGGFGKAYALTADDLAMQGEWAALMKGERSAVDHMNDDHLDAVAHYATHFGKREDAKWQLATMDTEGMTLVAGDQTCRVWYPEPLMNAGQMRAVLVDMAREARGE